MRWKIVYNKSCSLGHCAGCEPTDGDGIRKKPPRYAESVYKRCAERAGLPGTAHGDGGLVQLYGGPVHRLDAAAAVQKIYAGFACGRFQ